MSKVRERVARALWGLEFVVREEWRTRWSPALQDLPHPGVGTKAYHHDVSRRIVIGFANTLRRAGRLVHPNPDADSAEDRTRSPEPRVPNLDDAGGEA